MSSRTYRCDVVAAPATVTDAGTFHVKTSQMNGPANEPVTASLPDRLQIA